MLVLSAHSLAVAAPLSLGPRRPDDGCDVPWHAALSGLALRSGQSRLTPLSGHADPAHWTGFALQSDRPAGSRRAPLSL